MIFQRLQFYALTAMAVLLVLIGAYAAGGRKARTAAQRQRELDEARRAAVAAKETHNAQAHVDRLPPGAAVIELRRDWMRDE